MDTSVTKRMAKSFSWLVLGEIIGRGISFLAVIYIARILGAAAFGLLNFAQAFQSYLVLIVDSGLSTLGMREIARLKSNAGAISINIYAIRFFIALIVFVVSALILFMLPLDFRLRWLFIGAFLFVFYRAFNADWVFQGMEKMDYVAYPKIIYSALCLLFLILMVKSSADLVTASFIYAVIGILTSLVFLFILFKWIAPASRQNLLPKQWWQYFSEAIPLGASVILTQIYYNIDTIMLGFMDKPEVVGYYNAANKILSIFIGVLALWTTTAFPIIGKRIMEDINWVASFLNKYVKLTLMVIIPVMLLTAILAPFIIDTIFGLEYRSAALALQILIWGVVLLALSNTYGVLILVPLGKSKEFMYGVGSGAIFNLILNALLIPAYSYIGAAVATVLSEAIVLLVMYYLSRDRLRISIFKNLRNPLIGSMVALMAYLLTLKLFPYGYLGIVSASFAFMVIYLLVLLGMGEKPFILSFFNKVVESDQT